MAVWMNSNFSRNPYNEFMAEIVLTDHVKYRLFERGIDAHEAKKIAKNGKITKTESDGTLIKAGACNDGRILSVVSFKEGNKIIIKTAYYGN